MQNRGTNKYIEVNCACCGVKFNKLSHNAFVDVNNFYNKDHRKRYFTNNQTEVKLKTFKPKAIQEKTLKIEQITSRNEVVGRYSSIAEAARTTGINPSTIAKVINPHPGHPRYYAGGYKWRKILKEKPEDFTEESML